MAPSMPSPAPDTGGKQTTPGKILVADDRPENLLLLTTYLKREGYQPITAHDGAEAVRACLAEAPDLIIMDAAMPGMNGFEATREIRRLHPDKWIPIIFLSAYASAENQTRGLDAGADDYLSKPVNFAILGEKIKAMRRIADAQARVQRYAAQLEDSIEQARADQELAKHLLQRILHKELGNADGVQQWVRPAEHFSGDVIVTAPGPGGERYVLLADATGHGLAAAISVLPVIEAFYRLAEKGYSVASVVAELNRKIRQLMPRERFVAAAIAIVDPAQGWLQIWNGGLPAALFLDDAGRVVRSWHSTHLPLGTLPNAELDAMPEVFAWQAPGQLVLHSDGLTEADGAGGEMFGIERVQRVLAETARSDRFAALVEAVQAHIGDGTTRDDISLVMVDCPTRAVPVQPRPPGALAGSDAGGRVSSWRVGLHLEADQIKTLDIVPLLMGWLDQLQLEAQHRGTAFLVLAELVNNAVDHGLLRLDSLLKQAPDGFERYVKLRAERLARLASGSIGISIEHLYENDMPWLRIRVADSGEGFAHEDFLRGMVSSDSLASGRGIQLVRAIAGDLHYEGDGNVAVVRLPLAPVVPGDQTG